MTELHKTQVMIFFCCCFFEEMQNKHVPVEFRWKFLQLNFHGNNCTCYRAVGTFAELSFLSKILRLRVLLFSSVIWILEIPLFLFVKLTSFQETFLYTLWICAISGLPEAYSHAFKSYQISVLTLNFTKLQMYNIHYITRLFVLTPVNNTQGERAWQHFLKSD